MFAVAMMQLNASGDDLYKKQLDLYAKVSTYQKNVVEPALNNEYWQNLRADLLYILLTGNNDIKASGQSCTESYAQVIDNMKVELSRTVKNHAELDILDQRFASIRDSDIFPR